MNRLLRRYQRVSESIARRVAECG